MDDFCLGSLIDGAGVHLQAEAEEVALDEGGSVFGGLAGLVESVLVVDVDIKE